MTVLSTQGWNEYELLDSGEGYRLERFGEYRLARPDPQAIWKKHLDQTEWLRVDAIFQKADDGKEKWIFKEKVPAKWLMRYKDISFFASLSPFKHTGVFPEQIMQWDWIDKKIKSEILNLKSKEEKPNILNLFAYTGIASLVCAQAGAKVTHVDASKPTISWARENQMASSLQDKPIRWILDDAIKFTKREVKRGIRYDGIIMDPPVYGHGPNGERWDFKESFPQLLEVCKEVLSVNPLFILINAYAISSSALMLENVLKDMMKDLGGQVEVGELALQEKNSDRLLSTGIFGRWANSL
jgi:23S rRNA (cytosine1962-C5)-methyltransferase